jgi:predicted flavoprotein YhiN
MTKLGTQVAVIGAGPAGLMAAEVLAQGGAEVTVYDAMPSAGRKLLMAGRGGLNLTHNEPFRPSSHATVARSRISQPPSTPFRRKRCATGARRWGSRLLLAPADVCFQKRSRLRPC